MKFIPGEDYRRKMDAVRRLCARAIAAPEPYDGARFRVIRGAWADLPYRVYDKRLRALRGDFRALSDANARAAILDAELATPPVRARAMTAFVAAFVFTITASSMLRRLLP